MTQTLKQWKRDRELKIPDQVAVVDKGHTRRWQIVGDKTKRQRGWIFKSLRPLGLWFGEWRLKRHSGRGLCFSLLGLVWLFYLFMIFLILICGLFFFFFLLFEIKDKKFSIGLGLPNFLFTRVCKFLLYGVKKKMLYIIFFSKCTIHQPRHGTMHMWLDLDPTHGVVVSEGRGSVG